MHERFGFWTAAAVKTVAAILAAGIVFVILGVGEGDSGLAQSRAWEVWKIVAAFGITLAVALGIMGSAQLWQLSRDQIGAKRWVIVYVVLAVVLSALVVAFVDSLNSPGGEWPFDVSWRVDIAVLVVTTAAVPWLTLVWVGHDLLRRRAFLAPAAGGGVPALRDAWNVISSIVFVFSVFVIISMVTTGALRAAWLSQEGDAEAFPASDVLLYGAFFAVLLGAITFPLVASYRQLAARIVDGTYSVPADGVVTEAWLQDRSRLEGVVHLDVGVIRNPLTALSVFTPLVTAALAAFIPELAT